MSLINTLKREDIKNFTSAQIKEALKLIGINHESDTITKSDVLNYFNEIKPDKNEYKHSIPDIVKFLNFLDFNYSDYIDCDRYGLIQHFNKKIVLIDGNSSVDIKTRFINWWFNKPIKEQTIDKPSNFDEARVKYKELKDRNMIEILDDDLPFCQVISEDKKFYYKKSNDRKIAIDVTSTDGISIIFQSRINSDFFFLTEVTSDNKPGELVGLGNFVEKEGEYNLEIKKENIHIDFSRNNKAYKIIFSNERKTRWYAASLYIVSEELENDYEHILCIDFGTSNTSVGTWTGFDNKIQLVAFDDKTDPKELKQSFLYPSTVYIKNEKQDENENEPEMIFGYDAKRELIENDYNPNGAYFINIKQWLATDENVEKECYDEKGNTFKLSAKYIIGRYLKNVIELAEIKLKKHFVKLHFSAPVKLKSKFNYLVNGIFNEKNGYEVVPASESLDEGVAIIYDCISKFRADLANNKINSNNNFDGKIMVIDCGGGTTDIASCKYYFEKDETGIKANISTKFENGFDFGGNDLTYLIFQLLKIKLSEYYRKDNNENKSKFSIDNLLNGEPDSYLDEIDLYFEENKNKDFDYYQKLEEASCEAEWVLPTDFNNDKYVKTNKTFARRNFIYLWDWAERLKIKFFSSSKMASFYFIDDEGIKADKKSMYFYVDRSGKIDNKKLNLVKTKDVPDIEINNKELAVLLSPQIYYILHLAMPSKDILKDISIRLSGQSSKISLFRELLKEFIPGKETRGKLNTSTDPNDKKLACVKGCIQHCIDNTYQSMITTPKIDTPNIPYLVTINKDANTPNEILFDGSSIRCSNTGVNLMSRIVIDQRLIKDFTIIYKIKNKAYNKKENDKEDSININVNIQKSNKLNSLSDLIKRIKDDSLTGIEEFRYYEEENDEISEETLLERLERDLDNINSDSNGKLLLFAFPNNDGCGFILYQIAKFEKEGNTHYYITGADMIDYEKNTSKSYFDGCNCKL